MTENADVNQDFSKEELLEGLIAQISSYIEQYHGGSAEMVSFEDNKLSVRLGGACIGCALSESTMQGWVAGTVKQFFPDVEVIETNK
ncbi:MAG: NifU family protein [Chloroflexota bacterium]|nr:NifU family protein [Chloroflexota bacterium]